MTVRSIFRNSEPTDTRNVREKGARRVFATAALAAVVVTTVLPTASAGSTDFIEYAIPSAASLPQGITLGPDGALWFAERNAKAIGRIAADGTIAEFFLPPTGAQPFWITAGPDGNLWFTERSAGRIGRVTPAGAITEFAVPTAASQPAGIAAGPDGALWFAEQSGGKIGRITPNGTISEFATPTAASGPYGITAGPDGAMWFTEQAANKIGRITMNGVITEVAVTPANRLLSAITSGPDGNLWFTERSGQAIASISPDMRDVATWSLPSGGNPIGITTGPDGNLWFTENGGNRLGSISTDGVITEYPLPSPGSQPFGITMGPNGLWFTEQAGNRIGHLAVISDVTPPVIDIVTPSDGAWYVFGDAPIAEYTCSDEGGSGLATCIGPVESGTLFDASVGPHLFTVTATDEAGNQTSAVHSYVVFSAVYGPLIHERAHEAGRALPVTLEFDQGAPSPAPGQKGRPPHRPLTAATSVTQQVSCDDPSIAFGDSEFAELNARTVGTREHIVWKTERSWAARCRTLVLTFDQAGWEDVQAVFLVRFA
jgi:virginiamycin B lyase